MEKNAIIFGADGQDGRYLTKLLEKEGYDVIGIGRNSSCGIGRLWDVLHLVAKHRPNFIFHLAANSTTGHEAIAENHQIIGTGTLNILEAVLRYSPLTRVFLAGSGLQFRNFGLPVREDDARQANSAYVVARNYSAMLARYYRDLGVKVFFGYFFHHESPLRKPRHVSQIIAKTARQAAAGVVGPSGPGQNVHLRIGDLSVEKEWTFAGDMMEAVWLLVNQPLWRECFTWGEWGHGPIYEANLGTGAARSIEEWAEECFAAVGLDWRNYITEPPQGVNVFVPEYPRLVADPKRIFSLGWRPKVSFRELARMMVADCGWEEGAAAR